MEPKRAAIDMDALGDKPLSEVSAADFLAALQTGGLSAMQTFAVWPEKKKVELWAEPENLGRIPLRDLINVIRNEKKKRELEPWLGLDPGVIDPVRYRDLLDRLTRDLELRLAGRGSGDPIPARPGGDPIPAREYQELVERLARDVELNVRRRMGG